MPKRIETKVTSGRNGGIHCTKSYKKACKWIDGHSFSNCQLWHVVLIPSRDKDAHAPTRSDYETALDRLVERLRDAGMPTEYKAAFEQCPTKGFHRHCFLMIEAKDHKPAAILRFKETGWMVTMLKGFGLSFYLAPPRGDIHLTRKGKRKKYAYVPKTPGAMLDDCKEWISYIYKCRTKADVAAPIYSSSRKKTAKAAPARPTTITTTKEDTMILTTAQRYIATIYEGCIDKGMDVHAIRRHLADTGIARTPAQVVDDLDNVYSFEGYANSHPAPPMCAAQQFNSSIR